MFPAPPGQGFLARSTITNHPARCALGALHSRPCVGMRLLRAQALSLLTTAIDESSACDSAARPVCRSALLTVPGGVSTQ